MMRMQRPVSYDTSSKDPHMLRSRIFVGGLNTNTVTRDDVIQLFSSYGTILGVTLFKGYAFVQYSSMSEAELAVSALNYYHWHGSALEVKTVSKDQQKSSGSNGTVGKRPAQNESLSDAKKGRSQVSQVPEPSESRTEYSDFFVCGVCRFTTTNLEAFVKHRKTTCNANMAAKHEDEPNAYGCRSCANSFTTCWELVEHLGTSHNLSVYRDVSVVDGTVKTEMSED